MQPNETHGTGTAATPGEGRLFPALGSSNYRAYFITNGLSLVGTWMQRLATSWLVYRLTSSAVMLGAADFVSQFSAFLLMPVAGVILDGRELRRSIWITQVAALVQATVLAGLTLAGLVNLPLLFLLCGVLGAINAFDMPGRHALVPQLVERREHLGNAIALNSSAFNAARLIGPSLAGMAVAAWGEGICFVLNALSFVPIVWMLPRLTLPRSALRHERKPFWSELRAGFAYAWKHRGIRSILLLISVFSFIGMPFAVLLPVVAKEVLGGGAETLGFLLGAVGFGALAGALHLAVRRTTEGLERLASTSFTCFGLILMLFAWTSQLWASMLLLAIAGYWMTSGWAAANTHLQMLTDDDKRSRIMSLYMMAFMGMSPLGSLVQGFIAQHAGVSPALCGAGLLCCISSLAFVLSVRAARPSTAGIQS
ncbi:MAG TPA: MFS transporter [Candidatus Ozemobacteraceae bacterium]|nr:MFS transporter [Candidatus Ozemobacteraceae bacterium]